MNTQREHMELRKDVRKMLGKLLDKQHADLISDEIMGQVISHVNLSRLYQEKQIYREQDISAAIGYVLMERLEIRYPSTLWQDILETIDDVLHRKYLGLFRIGLAKEVEKELLVSGDFQETYWSTISNTIEKIYSRYAKSVDDATPFTVKEFIHQKGWSASCYMDGTEPAMTVFVTFDNNGKDDCVDFNINSFDTDELQECFTTFCKEEKCIENSVTDICIQKVGASLDALRRMEEKEGIV